MANKLIESYLNMLNEGDNPNDPSMPNPYDYQSVELDPNPRKEDFDNLAQLLKKTKNLQSSDIPLDPYIWLYCGQNNDPEEYGDCVKHFKKNKKVFTIVDQHKRVGIISIDWFPELTWASWVPGHNYSLRGVMKLGEELTNQKYEWEWYNNMKRFGFHTYIYTKNTPSIKTAMKLKMKFKKVEDAYYCEVPYPFWWFQKKENKHWWKLKE